jgi:hypothetical protein
MFGYTYFLFPMIYSDFVRTMLWGGLEVAGGRDCLPHLGRVQGNADVGSEVKAIEVV